MKTLAVIVLATAAILGFVALRVSHPVSVAQPESIRPEVHPGFEGELPASLRDLGLFTDLSRLEPAEGVLPYEVRYPLWSDGTHKIRHAYIPAGSKLAVDGDGQFHFPDGTILCKTFELQSGDALHRVETRVLAKQNGRWQYGAYVWRQGSDDASLSNGQAFDTGLSVPGGKETYSVPGRLTCLQCHAAAPDVAVGFAPYQLEDAMLETLRERGQLEIEPAAIPYREIRADNDLERHAIGYIAGNCAHCHNPSSSAFVGDELDLRPHMVKAAIGREAHRLQRPGMTSIIDPGHADSSVMLRLFERSFLVRDGLEVKMPPIGNQIVDPKGRELIRDWIGSLGRESASSAR
ncbi:MAG: hypothetical protein H6807_03205 [Planctomycetes bacterium]|nr:hypothetical protein [Planctomycetota bacterium]